MPALVESAVQRVGAEPAATPEALLRAGVDGVVIAAATDVHPELIIACLEAGLPTFCEKPVSKDPAASMEILRRTEDSGVPVQIGYPRRFDAAFVAAREGGRQRRAWAGSTRSAPRPWIPHHHQTPTSAPPAGSSGTAVCTTSTPFGMSPVKRSLRSMPLDRTRARPSSPMPDDVDTAATVLTLEVRCASGRVGTPGTTRAATTSGSSCTVPIAQHRRWP